MIAGKRIVLGVTGGIAAYKAVEITRRLVDAGAHVIPVMTKGAERFLGAATLSALASEPVKTRLWDDPDTPIPHTTLGQSADLVLVAPATARLIACVPDRPVDRPADQRAAGHPRPGDDLPGDAHRDVGAPCGGRQHGSAPGARRARGRARVGAPRRRRLRRRPVGITRIDRGCRRPPVRRPRPGRTEGR